MGSTDGPSRHDRALLRAIAAGRGTLHDWSGPVLAIDGRYCCDQLAAGRLVRSGLIDPPRGAQPFPARLTHFGRTVVRPA